MPSWLLSAIRGRGRPTRYGSISFLTLPRSRVPAESRADFDSSHAVFTDSPLGLIEAELCHRKHAVVEKVIEDLKHSALAH